MDSQKFSEYNEDWYEDFDYNDPLGLDHELEESFSDDMEKYYNDHCGDHDGHIPDHSDRGF